MHIPFRAELGSFAVVLKLGGKDGLDVLFVHGEDDASTSAHRLHRIRVVAVAHPAHDLVPGMVSPHPELIE